MAEGGGGWIVRVAVAVVLCCCLVDTLGGWVCVFRGDGWLLQYWRTPRVLICVFGGAAGLHDLLVPNLRQLVKKGAVGAHVKFHDNIGRVRMPALSRCDRTPDG